MIKQRPSRNETPMCRGSDDVCRCSHHGQRKRSRGASAKAAAHYLLNESYCDTKNADEQTSDDNEKHL